MEAEGVTREHCSLLRPWLLLPSSRSCCIGTRQAKGLCWWLTTYLVLVPCSCSGVSSSPSLLCLAEICVFEILARRSWASLCPANGGLKPAWKSKKMTVCLDVPETVLGIEMELAEYSRVLSEALVGPWAQCSALLCFSCSAAGACRFWKLMIFILSTKGFKQSVCSQSFYIHPISKLWVYIFLLSKLLELGESEASPYPMFS